ncbi:MAG TPA: TetR/AcrR family transcriptional regulator [bacterium]|jgi:TetR/AcrR family fatty acid metabolism transcriptional regulator|nr:TetR/AcrR family transcriptional regulator [bacterium]HNT65044.1 TetR/AcrR family transcriptional regulator [bacterium]HOX84451.1 TetR/AcrR family transcriptional regulator [bacterium]HPG45952.1 TetR/AcrR family transcriptional regulator [bacterium]HPM97774.1 TetR/AcrR family transcriptional regulator [bacterium]
MARGKREKILKAAVKIFARDGFFNAKMEEIARLAGVATGTTYLYFENKDDLLISIFEEEMIPIISNMTREINKAETAVDKLHAFINHHLELVKNKPDMAQLLEVELRQSSKFIHGYSGSKFREYLNLISSVFEEGQQRGIFRSDIQPTIFKQVLFGALDQISTNYTLSRSKKIDLNESAEQIANIFLNGVLR